MPNYLTKNIYLLTASNREITNIALRRLYDHTTVFARQLGIYLPNKYGLKHVTYKHSIEGEGFRLSLVSLSRRVENKLNFSSLVSLQKIDGSTELYSEWRGLHTPMYISVPSSEIGSELLEILK